MNSPTITINGIEHDVETLAAAKVAELRAVFDNVVKASTYNADLLEVLEDGSNFRIAFKKKGETDWTRIRVGNEDALRAAALREIGARQEGLMENLANLLGVNGLTINNI